MMLPSNAVEFEVDGEMYLGLIEPYSRYEAEQLLTTPAVFPGRTDSEWWMMRVVPVDQWISEQEAGHRG